MLITFVLITLTLLQCTNIHAFKVPTSKITTRKSSLTMAAGQVPMVPFYPFPNSRDYQWMDIYNALGRKRTIFVGRYLDEESCNQLIASLIWLQGQSEKDPITLYFNVPGAMVKPSLAVFDVMRRMKCPLITINTGLTVGMGALLCAVGTSGQRFAFPNARFLMAKGGLDDGIQGQASDLRVHVKDVMDDNDKVLREMAKLCGQPLDKLQSDFRRDFYLTAAEASMYGVIDKVMTPAQPIKMMRYRGIDDRIIGYGHFSESRKVAMGPDDTSHLIDPKEDIDEYATRELAKKGYDGRVDPRSLRNGGGANRFANSRCKPPGAGKPPAKKPPANPNNNDPDDFDKNPFKNTGW